MSGMPGNGLSVDMGGDPDFSCVSWWTFPGEYQALTWKGDEMFGAGPTAPDVEVEPPDLNPFAKADSHILKKRNDWKKTLTTGGGGNLEVTLITHFGDVLDRRNFSLTCWESGGSSKFTLNARHVEFINKTPETWRVKDIVCKVDHPDFPEAVHVPAPVPSRIVVGPGNSLTLKFENDEVLLIN
jgi:hypothetical protein